MAYHAPNLLYALLNHKHDSLIRRSQAVSSSAESLNATQTSDTSAPSVTSVFSSSVVSTPSTSSSTAFQVSQNSTFVPSISSGVKSSLPTSTASGFLSSVSPGTQISEQTGESSQSQYTATFQSVSVSDLASSSTLSSTSIQSSLTPFPTGTPTDATSSVADAIPAASGGPTSQDSQNTGSGDSQIATPGASHRNTLPIILGATLGTVALILLLVVFLFLRQRKRRIRQMAALKWDPVLDDTPLQSPVSSDSGHYRLVRMRAVPNSLDDHIYSHWVSQTHTSAHTVVASESLAPAPAESRHGSPSSVSAMSTVSTVTFARPMISVDTQGDKNTVNSTGHYMPSGLEC